MVRTGLLCGFLPQRLWAAVPVVPCHSAFEAYWCWLGLRNMLHSGVCSSWGNHQASGFVCTKGGGIMVPGAMSPAFVLHVF